MAYFKKRKKKGPNKNQERVARGNVDRNRAPLGTVYPQVAELVVDLEFVSQEGHVLENETRNFGPDDPLDLTLDCPGRCGNGTMDLAGKVENVVRNLQTEAEGRATCPMLVFAGSSETCGTQLVANIGVKYR